MKKVLLSSFLCVAAIAANAQVAHNDVAVSSKFNKVEIVKGERTSQAKGKVVLTGEAGKMDLKKALQSHKVSTRTGEGLTALYDIPTGALIEGLEPGAGWYSIPYLYTPALTEQTWWNYTSSDDKATTIEYNWGEDSKMDEDGNGLLSMFGSNYGPVLTATQDKAISEYTFGQDGQQGKHAWFGGTDEWVALGAARFGNGCGPYSGFNGLDLNTNTPGDSNGAAYFDGNIVGFAQFFDATNDVLAIKGTTLTLGADDNSIEAPLGGKTLTCTVYAIKEDGTQGDILATATATDDDVITTGSWLYSFTFNFVETDPLLGEIESPIYVENTPILVVYSGFDQVKTTFYPPFCSADGFAGGGYMLLDNGSMTSVFYRGSTTPQIDLLASLDAYLPLLKPTESMTETVTVGLEGGYVVTAAKDGKNYNDYDFYSLTPAGEWEVDAPEWISVEFDEAYESAEKGIVVAYFKAEPSTESRSGEITFTVYGKTQTITIQQGEATGITSVANGASSASKSFNVAGQQINKGFKGIVIRDGKKFIQE